MNIAFVLPGSSRRPIGGYKVVYEYANCLAKKGHTVTIYYFINNTLQKFLLPRFIKHLLSKMLVHFRPRWFKLDNRIKQVGLKKEDVLSYGNHDSIIATAVETAIPVAQLPQSCGKKYYFIQDFENWNLGEEEVFETYRLPMKKIVVAKWLQKVVYESVKDRSVLVSNSIDTDTFYAATKIEYRNKYHIVFHYRSAAHKGCRYAIEAIKMLHDDYPELIVHAISNEKCPSEMPEYVVYHHSIPANEVARINNESAIFLCSSIEEGFGLPGLEAMACGCALVSSSYRGVYEYGVNNENALLVEKENAVALYEGVKELIENDTLRLSLARAGIETGKKRSLKVAAEEFEKVLLKG